jgi:integrase
VVIIRDVRNEAAAHALPRSSSLAASLLIGLVSSLVEVSKLLGHSEIRVTADLYGHLVKETATTAARIMDGLLAR